MRKQSKNATSRSTKIGWFDFKAATGTVYLMQPDNDPRLFKLGFTSRRTLERRRELQRPGDGKLRIICSVTMPHAYALEQRLLGRMRGGWRFFRRRSSPRGTEWFYLRRNEQILDIQALMEREARRVRLAAAIRFSWSLRGRILLFEGSRTRIAGAFRPVLWRSG